MDKIIKTTILILALVQPYGSFSQKKDISTEKIFKRLDKDKDGAISLSEAEKAKKSLIYHDFNRIDTDKNMTISLEELKAIRNDPIEQPLTEQMP